MKDNCGCISRRRRLSRVCLLTHPPNPRSAHREGRRGQRARTSQAGFFLTRREVFYGRPVPRRPKQSPVRGDEPGFFPPMPACGHRCFSLGQGSSLLAIPSPRFGVITAGCFSRPLFPKGFWGWFFPRANNGVHRMIVALCHQEQAAARTCGRTRRLQVQARRAPTRRRAQQTSIRKHDRPDKSRKQSECSRSFLL